LINAGDIDGFGDCLAADFVEHAEAPGVEPTKEGVKQLFHVLRETFPDFHMDVEAVLPSGDTVVARIRATGTHKGDGFMGLPATGRSVDVELIDITRFGDDGIAREHWGLFDALGMLQQMGVVPPPPGT
jgi:predicted ester cyclase